MKFFYLFLLSLVFFRIGFSQADHDTPFRNKQEDMDMDALKEWVDQKRLISIKDLGGKVSLSGEVRVETLAINEKRNGIQQRGAGGATERAAYAYDVEFNLLVDYRAKRTWAAVKIEFDNDMGTVGGTMHSLALERAYLGGRAHDGETFIFDIEIGRRNLGNVFDSRLEFSSLFDGILFKLNNFSESIGDFYANLAGLVISDRENHYGYAIETGLLRIADSNFYSKYSFIDWTKDYYDPLKKLAFNFRISQLVFGYQRMLASWNNAFLKIYTGGLLNHAAKGNVRTEGSKKNYGWYAGISIGQVVNKGDWAMDVNYQILAAQAVPDFDVGGIRRGNAKRINFYSKKNYGRGEATTKETAVGGGNYKGLEAEALYAITNNLTILNNFQISRTLDKSIGPNLKFMQYEVELIYAF